MVRGKLIPSVAFSLVIKYPKDYLFYSSPEAKKFHFSSSQNAEF